MRRSLRCWWPGRGWWGSGGCGWRSCGRRSRWSRRAAAVTASVVGEGDCVRGRWRLAGGGRVCGRRRWLGPRARSVEVTASVVGGCGRCCGRLRTTPAHLGSRLTVQTGRALLSEREERGRTPVLVVDEAHLMSCEQLECIRMLTNQGMDQDSPLSCLLVGRPTLRRTMKLAVLAALEQRTALRYTMPGMTSTETASYVAHGLKIAGRPDQLFTEDALPLIHTTSRGYPRAVNNLSPHALVAAFATGKNLVDEAAARASVGEVVGD
ncbi:AAA family ATPase [Streptomyces griseorubiginosus]|uniref:ExeA family protein n=1 Tax=Streptomyces griseorubiginosus TaxID=67304 RepID=UPI0033AA1F99